MQHLVRSWSRYRATLGCQVLLGRASNPVLQPSSKREGGIMRGHLRKRGGNSWEIKFDLGRDPASGKRQTRYHSFKGTKREAQAELTRLLADANKGAYIDASKETVGEFLDRWDRDWAAANVGLKTLERYRQLIKNQVQLHIG